MFESRIYITDLASYNEGLLIGQWVTLPIDDNDLKDKIQEILSDGHKIASKKDLCACEYHEEYFITDYENIPFDIDQYSDPYKINYKIEQLEELIDDLYLDDDIVDLLINHYKNESFDDLLDLLENENYRIYHDVNNFGDIVYQAWDEQGILNMIQQGLNDQVNEGRFYKVDSMGYVLDNITDYIDYERIGRDWEINGDYITDFKNNIAIEIFH